MTLIGVGRRRIVCPTRKEDRETRGELLAEAREMRRQRIYESAWGDTKWCVKDEVKWSICRQRSLSNGTLYFLPSKNIISDQKLLNGSKHATKTSSQQFKITDLRPVGSVSIEAYVKDVAFRVSYSFFQSKSWLH